MNSRTRVCGLIGYPVEHSVSPQMHNAGFLSLGLNYVYLAFPVRKGRLKEALNGMRALGFKGLNVTTPHKIDVIGFLDDLDDNAKRIGSINTILNDGGRLLGFNTDGAGALKAIGEKTVADRNVLILGAGGSARAIAFALSEKASKITVLNRDESKAVNLARDLRDKSVAEVFSGQLEKNSLHARVEESDVIVNATTVGMYPHSDGTILRGEYITDDKVVFDAVYNPFRTRLIKEAEAKGAKTIYGYEMLLQQGAESFKIWTRSEPPIKVMREAILKELIGYGRIPSEKEG